MDKKETEEARWEAERDAGIIQEYAKIKADSKRYNKALKVIRTQKNELAKILKSKEG